MPVDREDEKRAFLQSAGWGAARVAPIPGDASTRHYSRLDLNGRKAILMDQPQHAETPVAAANATPEERKALGYNAIARLAGADVDRFAATADYLRKRGFSAPEIYALAGKAGFAIIEDLGNDLYHDVMAGGGDEAALYKAAVEALAMLHLEGAPLILPRDKALHAYDETALLAEVDLFPQWFFPVALGREATADEHAEHTALWKQALDPVMGLPPVFVHRDYHSQNLLWLPDRKGVARVGMIDFQDGLAGSAAYDLMSMLEDARRDVSGELLEAGTRHYIDTMKNHGVTVNEEAFRAEMALLSGQRKAKVLGIFARLYKRDGKPRYLTLLPRVWGYMNRGLEHPALADLRTWYDKRVPMEARGEPRVNA
jgi:aminoglycoside/choline kinase family phosphotransferase